MNVFLGILSSMESIANLAYSIIGESVKITILGQSFLSYPFTNCVS
jgi:hypothetical protein